MGKREKWKGGFMERSADGRFKDHVSFAASYRADRRTKAKNVSKPGYGHQGDQRKGMSHTAMNNASIMNSVSLDGYERMTAPRKGINILGRLIIFPKMGV